MTKQINRLKKLAGIPRLAESLAILGGIIYSGQIWLYAHTQNSLIDEGLYLLKGYLFATGKYTPFQPYGLWTNHMPLSFLIPGYAQVIFGPGLRTGRYLAIFLAVLFLIGIWIVSHRLGGKWLAAGAVFAVALNPALIKIYSIMTSQGLVACILVWIMVLILGEERPLWQIIFGAILAGLLPLTRLNLLPVLPFVIAYLFWENGWKVGIIAAIAGIIPFLGGHLLYWPNIMTMWVKWFPEEITPFLDIWRPQGIGVPTAVQTVSTGGRIASLFEGIRFHFVPVLGAFATWLFWPKTWKKQAHFRIIVFLSSLFIVLFVLHAWASLGGNYCIFCFSNYLAFFSFLGILLIVVSLPNWRRKISPWRDYLAFLIMLLVVAGIGYSYAVSAAHGLIGSQIMDILERKVPAMLNSKYTGLTLWDALAKKYHWSYWEQTLTGTRIILISVGIIICMGLVAAVTRLKETRALGVFQRSILSISFAMFLALGGIIAPTEPLGGGRHNYDCDKEIITSYEETAAHVSKYIEPGNSIYLAGSGAQAILLEIGNIQVFPSQINSGYSYHKGGDVEMLTKYGFWNEALRQQWIWEADVLIIAERGQSDFDEYLATGKFEAIPPSPEIGCLEGSSLWIYRRLP